MNTEVKEKLEVSKPTIAVRLDIPKKIHEKIVKHQFDLTGRMSRSVNFKQATIDLLTIATKSIKAKS